MKMLKIKHNANYVLDFPENTRHRGKDDCTADLQLTGLDLYSQENLLLFVCNQTTEKNSKAGDRPYLILPLRAKIIGLSIC